MAQEKERYRARLASLARLYGIQTSYVAAGKRRRAPSESLLATLHAQGEQAPAGFDELEDVLYRRRHALITRRVEPVVVAWGTTDQGSGSADVVLTWPISQRSETIDFTLLLEDGSTRRWSRRQHSLAELGRSEWDGSAVVTKRARIPGKVPFGYHRLSVQASGWGGETHIIVAPMKAFSKEGSRNADWGIFAPLYGLRREDGWGCGDFTDLDRLLEWTGEKGGNVVATLPFMSSFLDQPFEPSPYSPLSRLFWNELYVDPTRAPEWASCPEARSLYASPAFQGERARLRESTLVDYRGVMELKRRVLELLSESVHRRLPERRAALEQFVAGRPLLADYARFRAVMDRRRIAWTEWPVRQRDGQLVSQDYNAAATRYHIYAQWLAHQQLTALKAKAQASACALYLDFPLGAHPHGFDVWRAKNLFCRDVSVGAPPDPIFTTGQNWGFPPLHPETSRRDAHQYFRACIRQQLEQASVLRIDHVMGLHRLFWIPKGFEVEHGVYVHYPADELYAILTLESHRHRAVLVGENLGVVPRTVDRAMAKHDLKKMFVLQYALRSDPKSPIARIPPGSVASLNTHDTPLFGDFWKAQDIDRRRELGLVLPEAALTERAERQRQRGALLTYLRAKGDLRSPQNSSGDAPPDAVLRACLGRLSRSGASLILATLEDLWLEGAPQNVPGSGEGWHNWQRKLQITLEKLDSLPSVREAIDVLNQPPR